MASNIFGKFKGVFTKHPEQEKKPAPSSSNSLFSNDFTLSDVISDEFKQIKRKVLLGKSQPYTRDEILSDYFENKSFYELYKALEGVSQEKLRDLDNNDSFKYFKQSSPCASKSLLEHFSSNETIDLGSNEVLNIVNSQQESPQEKDDPLFCIALLGSYNDEPIVMKYDS